MKYNNDERLREPGLRTRTRTPQRHCVGLPSLFTGTAARSSPLVQGTPSLLEPDPAL